MWQYRDFWNLVSHRMRLDLNIFFSHLVYQFPFFFFSPPQLSSGNLGFVCSNSHRAWIVENLWKKVKRWLDFDLLGECYT
ncbi:hypothetical protein AAHA92_33995 [Salvia divinorum]|uniref:Maturase K n=1 Tax=Salvia divinorum TaxID=28513 RepID=A0ABD1FHH0_SALDI